jgi:pyridoxamine 5'-phosphate oxidase family protein
MSLTSAEVAFLTRQPRGYLTTLGPDGWPQVKPLGFTYNSELATIDIAGFRMGASAKYRNIQADPKVSFVVDEVTEPSMEGAHFLEIRGLAEPARRQAEGHQDAEIIRIRPTRVVSFNISPDQPGMRARQIP